MLVCQVIVIEDELSQVSCPITTKLILDQDEDTKTPLVQVHRNLVTSLKPHQVDGQFDTEAFSQCMKLTCLQQQQQLMQFVGLCCIMEQSLTAQSNI